jgi:hypothetical protein
MRRCRTGAGARFDDGGSLATGGTVGPGSLCRECRDDAAASKGIVIVRLDSSDGVNMTGTH